MGSGGCSSSTLVPAVLPDSAVGRRFGVSTLGARALRGAAVPAPGRSPRRSEGEETQRHLGPEAELPG